jgi:hypothetical protein
MTMISYQSWKHSNREVLKDTLNTQKIEMKVFFSNNLEEYKKGNKVVVESIIKYFLKSW